MAVLVTKRAVGIRDVAGPQEGDAFTVADGAVSAALEGGFYKVKATSACTVRFGAGLTDASGGEAWDDGEKEMVALADGDVIAVDAA